MLFLLLLAARSVKLLYRYIIIVLTEAFVLFVITSTIKDRNVTVHRDKTLESTFLRKTT